MKKIEVNVKEVKKDTLSFFSEFKKFIQRGNVMDLAVGVVLGSAFSSIVTSLVNDIIMPLVGMLIGGHDFTNLVVKVGDATLHYGTFIQNVVNFIIIAFCIFVVIKLMNKFFLKEKKEETKKTNEEYLLEEIRDLLKEKK